MSKTHARRLTSREAADRCQVTPRTIERWAADGILPGVRLGRGSGVLQFRLEDVEALIARSAAA